MVEEDQMKNFRGQCCCECTGSVPLYNHSRHSDMAFEVNYFTILSVGWKEDSETVSHRRVPQCVPSS